MGILFYGDNLQSPSHLWMWRMIDGLSGHISVLATRHRRSGTPEKSHLPAFQQGTSDLLLLGAPWRSFLRSGRKMFVGLTENSQRLSTAMERDDVSCALVHFLTRAVRFQDVWKRTSKPVFIHCHGIDVTWTKHAARRRGWRRLVYRDYIGDVLKLPPNVRFIANSERTKRQLLQIGLAENRIDVKYLGVPVPDRLPLRAEPRGRLKILYLGRLIDCKGPDQTIRAFELACGAGLDAELIMAGDGPLRKRCETLRKHSPVADRIRMLGTVGRSDGERLRLEADIFTAHSQTDPVSRQEEAFGVAFVEAMAAALPVVTGRSGGVPEVIRDGEDGILFEPGDTEAHAEALCRLAKDSRIRISMGQSGFARAQECFSVDREMRQLKSLLGLQAA